MGLSPEALHTGRAGCPGVGPDVRGFMGSRMSGLTELVTVLSGMACLDFRGEAGCPGVGEAPDVRGL